ncbi:uncharacterized protein LDX57_006829 [Aspergillus melleus]|uniref:uncharacterized protein n=1 Tax=Aspergillus melleus TaxID=138277 RepID=UPI001E8E2DF7|nr:uncharacterized protein LDX57_006829 [Aspergillus melleus]KAH8429160.1 hypothetical protein LDX57_006829 [Aspergillus melleus]
MLPFWIPGACRPLAATLWGEHIQDQLTYVNSSVDLQRLAEDKPDFQTYFKDQVITKDFASSILDVDTNHVYSIAILLVADYLYYHDWRPTWDDKNSNNALVDEDRPSYQILSAWAMYHWETEPDPDDAFINTLMALGGQRATALLLPSLDPQLPSAAMQAFFEKVVQTTDNKKYKRDIGDGLDRWMDISGMADGWTSFAERLYSAFSEEMGPEYERAMQTAVKKGKYYKIHKWCEDALNAFTFNLPLLLPDTAVEIGSDQRSISVERLYAKNPKCVAMAETF